MSSERLVPETAALRGALAAAFADDALKITGRRANVYISTFPTEIVTCSVPSGEVEVLCKYSAGLSHDDLGHRGGVAYEERVYRDVLGPLPLSQPRFFGAHRDGSGEPWLFVEYLGKVSRILNEPELLPAAARWAARFHALNAPRVADEPLQFLNRYDERYYTRWAERAAAFTEQFDRSLSWVRTAAAGFAELAALLAAQPPTVVHGEFTMNNVLTREREICPVDWESAAVGVGEIDLAALTDRWPRETAAECEREYSAARWPEGAPMELGRVLGAARLYWSFRWLGNRPDSVGTERHGWRVEQARATAEELGVI